MNTEKKWSAAIPRGVLVSWLISAQSSVRLIISVALILFARSAQAQASAEAISREVSIFNFGQRSVAIEATSREVSVFNFGQPSAGIEAISREVSVFNFGQPSASNEAISREVSVFNFGQPSAGVEAISRELSVFNFGAPSASVEAVSREVSVFTTTNGMLTPVILTHPTNQTVVAGSNAVLTVAAAGTPPLSYQWLFNGTNTIAGAIQPILSLTNAEPVAAGNYRVVVMNPFGAVTSQVATLTVASPPVITRQPASQVLLQGQQGTFSIVATGTLPMGFQWRRNGQPFITQVLHQTNASLTLFNVQPADSGLYQVIITNIANPAPGVPSDVATLTVFAPLTLGARPASTNVAVGSTATFCVSAGGTPPVLYQWRHNGANIPDATNACLVITNVQLADGGSYNVAIENPAGTTVSDDVSLTITVPAVPPGDNFTNRVSLGTAFTNSVSGTNSSATFEVGEPRHAGKAGGKSVWYTWTAPANGIATFRTVGSAFDTLLAVYTGNSVTNLTTIADDEDSGGFFTSQLKFRASAGTQYHIAIDGFAGAEGAFVLSWELEPTLEVLPQITAQPLSRTVLEHATATFTVAASGGGLTYQWFFNGAPLPGATSSTLVVANVRPENVGFYFVRVSNSSGRVVQSDEAILEIGPEPDVQSQDKFQDLFFVADGGAGALRRPSAPKVGTSGFLSLAAGVPLLLVVNNTNSSTERFEPTDCRITGASRWMTMRAVENGFCIISTLGSSNTTVSVYTGSNYLTLRLVICDGAPDGMGSLVKFPATAGIDYRVRVDGVKAREGVIRINAQLGHAPVLSPTIPTNPPVNLGESLAMQAPSLVANSGTTLRYQWRLNGREIASATNAVYAIAALQPDDSGQYSLTIENEFAQITQTLVEVTLHVPYINSAPRIVNGAFRLILQRPLNQNLVLEGSDDLQTWTAIHTVPITVPGPAIDLPITNQHRFFRARPWP